MREGFFKRFIDKELYLQNQPLITKDFIDFCRKVGINTNEKELEFFEKENLLYPILRVKNPKNSIPPHNYIRFSFSHWEKDSIKNLLMRNEIYDPSKLDFQPYSNFIDEESKFSKEKISSYYSSFQIHWLIKLKESYSFNINFAGEKIRVSSCLPYLNEQVYSSSFSIENLDELNSKWEERCNSEFGELIFNFKKKKELLIKMYKNFEKILEFLLSIQFIYAPYGKSGAKYRRNNDENWYEKRRKFNPKDELDKLEFTIQEVVNIYGIFSEKTNEILGVKRDDWIQLWKSIAWDEKDRLEGSIRLGIEYLQWALMVKQFIEDYCEREILDVDEMTSISRNDILKYNPSEMDGTRRLTRDIRINKYFDPEENKNYYQDTYKRLFYLANDFELNYQPRIMVFVEGETEEELFPKIFEWYYGNKPEHMGIEIMNFKGVDKLLSTFKNAKKLRNIIRNIEIERKKAFLTPSQDKKLGKLIKELKKTDIVISNWRSFISYNLKKWQIIPFFVSDNEGNVKHFLDAGKSINFKGNNYNIPDDWKYLWGETNNNKPYNGNNFELANFSDEEILLAINQVLDDEIDINKIKEVRELEDGIKKIDDRLDRKKNRRGSQNKRNVVKVLFEDLFKEYEETRNELLLERPIFELIDIIWDLARFNHPPISTVLELYNRNKILDLLNGKRDSIIDEE